MMSMKEMHEEALASLNRSREIMEKLASVCPDWSANTMLKCDFEQMEESLLEYGRHQLGLGKARREQGSIVRG